MAKSGVQFHSDPEELCHFLSDVARESGLYISAIWEAHSFILSMPKGKDFLARIEANGTPRHVFVTEKPPVFGEHRSTQDFLRANPGTLSVDIGQLTQDGLDQSFMGFLTEDEDVAKRWRHVINRLKRKTRSGGKTVNVMTGLRGVNRSHRYTAAAQKLANQGVKMWALGRKTLFEFPAWPSKGSE